MIAQFGAEAICSLAGVPQPNTAVTVRQADGSIARLFTDASGTTVGPNPALTDQNGDLVIFLAPGKYFYQVGSGAPVVFNVVPDVTSLGTPGGLATLDTAGHVPITQLSTSNAGGLATLDNAGHVPVGQLPAIAYLDGSSLISLLNIPNLPQSQVIGLTTSLNAKANDNVVVHIASSESITGSKTFSATISVVGVQFNAGAKITSGIGAPTASGTAGDLYFRSDTPFGIYRCLGTTSWSLLYTPGVWNSASLLNSWAALAGESVPAYRLLPDTRVELRGGLGTGTSGTTAFTLPTSLRPPTTFRRTIPTSAGVGLLQVSTTGNVTLSNITSIVGSVTTAAYIDGVVFPTT